MNIGQLEKVVENVYSLKHQRTLSYKIESGMMQKVLDGGNNSIVKRKIKSRTRTFIDRLEPIESLKAITGKTQKLTSLYSSRLLPSQFLVTPIEVLNKLTDRVYNYSKKPKKSEEKTELGISPTVFLEKKSKKFNYLQGKKLDSHTMLENSCKKILKDNKKSRKILKVASQFLSKRRGLNELISERPPPTELNGFKKRLKEAHNYLVNLDKIPGHNSHSKLITTQ